MDMVRQVNQNRISVLFFVFPAEGGTAIAGILGERIPGEKWRALMRKFYCK